MHAYYENWCRYQQVAVILLDRPHLVDGGHSICEIGSTCLAYFLPFPCCAVYFQRESNDGSAAIVKLRPSMKAQWQVIKNQEDSISFCLVQPESFLWCCFDAHTNVIKFNYIYIYTYIYIYIAFVCK